jgi:hypothetical protein
MILVFSLKKKSKRMIKPSAKMRAFQKSTNFIDLMFETEMEEDDVKNNWITGENNKVKRKRK